MLSVLFVDDESNVLQGTRRATRGMRQVWQAEFLDGGADAVEHVGHNRVDVIVTDLRMPDMDGVEVLSRVRTISPSTVRIILSGYAEEEAILRSTRVAHRFLAKPCDLEHLTRVIEEIRQCRNVVEPDLIREVIGRVQQLPSLGDVHARLVEAIADPTSTNDTIGEIVSCDVALTAELLRMVNSAYFGLSARIESVSEAVRFLGVEVVQAIVAGHALFGRGPVGVVDVAEVARRSRLVAALARTSVRLDGGTASDAATAYLAGMLHQVGVLIMGDLAWAEGDLRVILAGEDTTTERMVFGVDRYVVGGYLLGLWGFDPRIVGAINELADRDGPDRAPVARALLMADEAVRSGRIEVGAEVPDPETLASVLVAVGQDLAGQARCGSAPG